MESDEIQFVSTQRNQQKLVYRGRCYTLKRTNRNDKCWICASVNRQHLGFYQFLQLILDEQGKTETVVRQIDDGYTHGRGSVRRSAAYGVQQRRVAALTGRLVRNEISVEYFLSAISYHTPEPLRL
ncbi:hypothetical protein T06_6762 [Trichinella sp. T6]|nr:hypothetical protein T06_6762 [Trichinella sp. T6]